LEACKRGENDKIRILAKKVDINCRHELGWTPLMVAAMNSRADTVKLLLELGADPNLGDEFSTVFRMAKKLRRHVLEGKLCRIGLRL